MQTKPTFKVITSSEREAHAAKLRDLVTEIEAMSQKIDHGPVYVGASSGTHLNRSIARLLRESSDLMTRAIGTMNNASCSE